MSHKSKPITGKAAQPTSQPPVLPPTWGLVNGKPFTRPLPDGKPIDRAAFARLFPPLVPVRSEEG